MSMGLPRKSQFDIEGPITSYKRQDFLASFQKMRDLTFKKSIIRSAFQKSGLYPFDPSVVLAKMAEFSTPERTLAAEDSGSEPAFEIDFKRAVTPMSPRIYKAYTSYIDKKLAWSIEHGMTLTPTTGKLIAKREKANKTNLLSGQLTIEELFKKQQAELYKIQPNGERIVQQFGTILVGDARLRTMTRDLDEERRVDALQARKAESLRKKRQYREGVEKRREEREAKKAEKQAQKAARAAQLASLISRPPALQLYTPVPPRDFSFHFCSCLQLPHRITYQRSFDSTVHRSLSLQLYPFNSMP
jgi:hypothetical protein